MDADFLKWLPIGISSALVLILLAIGRSVFAKLDGIAASQSMLQQQIAIELRALDVRIAVVEAHLEIGRK